MSTQPATLSTSTPSPATTPPPARVCYSGSRTWPAHWAFLVETSVLGWAARLAGQGVWPVFVHGACPQGVDGYVDKTCDQNGLEAERHAADWSLGRSAGIQRNAVMIKSRPLVVVMFRLDGSAGTSYMLDAAGRAGLHWELYDATTTASDPRFALINYSTSKAPTPVPLASMPFADPLGDLDRFGTKVTGIMTRVSDQPVVITEHRDPTRCVHELIRDQCAVCRPRAKPARVAGRARTDRPSRPFGAMFDGDCSECGDQIEAGELIRMVDGAAVCGACGDQAEADWRASR